MGVKTAGKIPSGHIDGTTPDIELGFAATVMPPVKTFQVERPKKARRETWLPHKKTKPSSCHKK